MRAAAEIVKAYWYAADDRDWNAFAELLADDVVYEGPQTRERVRGAGNYVRFNVEGFPGDWHLRVGLSAKIDTRRAGSTSRTRTALLSPGCASSN